MTPVISVENLSKSYRLGQIGTGTLSRDLSVWWARLRGKPNPLLKIGQEDRGNLNGETLWALRDVSFQVEQGEVLGIIGRNGAGKSTLLKILSRVTAPTSGRVKVKGRIASLLEVGTGFHPELTGRENVYLNGAILGMTREEVTRKFDEIVDFAEVEQFIDTPVKRYSSGMYVRLAFAVAAHLEPEILLVDEVLAVGDAEFQKKCLGKMGDVAKEGRTVLFVSHNMGAISNLCPDCVLLVKGGIEYKGVTSIGIKKYLASSYEGGMSTTLDPNHNTTSPIVLQSCMITNLSNEPIRSVSLVEGFNIIIKTATRSDTEDVDVGIRFSNNLDQPIFSLTLSDYLGHLSYFSKGVQRFTISLPGNFLAPGRFRVTVGIHQPGKTVFDNQADVLIFKVEDSGSNYWRYKTAEYGYIIAKFPWTMESSLDNE